MIRQKNSLIHLSCTLLGFFYPREYSQPPCTSLIVKDSPFSFSEVLHVSGKQAGEGCIAFVSNSAAKIQTKH